MSQAVNDMDDIRRNYGNGENISAGKSGVVVLGHGSRAEGAAAVLESVAGRLARDLDCPVRAAALQFNHPSLSECCRDLISEGMRQVIIVPYFLFNGNHIRQDIPGEIEELRGEFGDVEFILSAGLGDDYRLTDILKQRVMEATGRGSDPPSDIEAESFAIIDGLLGAQDTADPAYQVVRRVVHASGDPSLAPDIYISPGAIEAALAALKQRAGIVCDVNMVAAGIMPSARRRGIDVHCGIATDDAAALSRSRGITRAAAAIRLFAQGDGGASPENAIVAIGNAPTALFECLDLARRGIWRPSLVVGVPVGFVGAAESKQALMDSQIPHITIPGNRGGSNIAAAAVNALLRLSSAAGDSTEMDVHDKSRDKEF